MVLEIDEWASRGTLDAIALAGFGFDYDSITKPHSELIVKYRQAFLPGKVLHAFALWHMLCPSNYSFD